MDNGNKKSKTAITANSVNENNLNQIDIDGYYKYHPLQITIDSFDRLNITKTIKILRKAYFS